ncbi:MAG: hypothetical protein M3R15_04900 [Acidobacteriota bacterium]|nr:hypothetical protein [Acidobacteriota bacterium]
MGSFAAGHFSGSVLLSEWHCSEAASDSGYAYARAHGESLWYSAAADVFKSFRHIHEFLPHGNGTLMKDTLIWTSPLDILGKIADKLLIERHLRNLVQTRNTKLKEIAES